MFSAGLFWLALLVHGLVVAVILALLGAGWGALCLVWLTAVSLVSCLRMSGLAIFRKGLASLRWHDDETWTLSDRRGRSFEAVLDTGALCTPRLMVLNWHRQDGRAVSAAFFTDSKGGDALRRLRLRLRSSGAV